MSAVLEAKRVLVQAIRDDLYDGDVPPFSITAEYDDPTKFVVTFYHGDYENYSETDPASEDEALDLVIDRYISAKRNMFFRSRLTKGDKPKENRVMSTAGHPYIHIHSKDGSVIIEDAAYRSLLKRLVVDNYNVVKEGIERWVKVDRILNG